MKTNKKAITITITLLAIIIAGISIIFSLLYLNKDNQKAIPYVNPVVENRVFFIDEGLPKITLGKGDTAGEITWVVGQEITEGLKAYKWKFSPFKVKIYQELEGSINLTFANRQNISLITSPVTSQIVYGLNLSNSSFTGGKVVSQTDGSVVTGKWSWVEPLITPNASEERQNFLAQFTPDNKMYKSRVFEIPVKVNKRELIITPTYDQFKYQDEEDPQLTFHLIGNVIDEEPKFVGSLQREQGEDLGAYKITMGTLALVDDENGLFKKDNYELVFNKKAGYDFVFKIQEKVVVYSVKIGDVELVENENIVLKQYDGKSITVPVVYHNVVASEIYNFSQVYDSSITTNISYGNIISPGNYKLVVTIGNYYSETSFRPASFEYRFTIEKAECPNSNSFEIAVPHTNNMILADIPLDNSSEYYTLSWKDSLSSQVNAGENTFIAVYTPNNTMLYKSKEVEVKVIADASNVKVPVVFNGDNCVSASYENGYNLSYISSQNNDYKLKVKFRDYFGSLENAEDFTVRYKYKLDDGSYSMGTLDSSYYSLVYNENYNYSKIRADFGSEVEYLVYQSDCSNPNSYLDLSLDYIYINSDGVNFLKNNNATLIIDLKVDYAERWMRKISSTKIASQILEKVTNQWDSNIFYNNTAYLYYRTADKSSGVCLDFQQGDVRNVIELDVLNQHYNLYYFNKESSFEITYYYKDEVLFKSKVASNSFVNVATGNQYVDTIGNAVDFDLKGVQEIPVGWCLDKDGNGVIYESNNAFANFGTDVNIYLITIKPFIVKYRYTDAAESPKIEDKLITSAKELKQALYCNDYSWSVADGQGNTIGNNLTYAYKYIINGVLTLVRNYYSGTSSELKIISADDIIVGNWSNERFNTNESEKYYFNVNKDGSFVLYLSGYERDMKFTYYYSGLVYKNYESEYDARYKLRILNDNGEATDAYYDGYTYLNKNRLVFDDFLQEYVYINELGINVKAGSYHLYSTESNFKVINFITKQSISDSNFVNKIILLTGDDLLLSDKLLLNNVFTNTNSLHFYKDLVKLEKIEIIKESISIDGITTNFYYLDFSNFETLSNIYVLNEEIVSAGENKNITYINAKIHLLNNTTQTIRLHDRVENKAFIHLFESYIENNKLESYDVWKILGFKLKAIVANGDGTTEYEKYFMNDSLSKLNYSKIESIIAEALTLGVDVDIYPIIQTSNDKVSCAGLINKNFSVTYTLDGQGTTISYPRTIWFDEDGYYNCNSDNDIAYKYGKFSYDEKTKTGYFYEGVLNGVFVLKDNGNIVHNGIEYILDIE